MDINVQRGNGGARVTLGGRFDFNCHREFRTACEDALGDPSVKNIEVDFGRVDYLDSSALGMLLQLRERATAANRPVKLANCRGIVVDVLKVANFGKLFTIN